MLTPDTFITLARNEYNRNEDFKAFVQGRLSVLRQLNTLPERDEDCLALHMINGRPLGQVFLDIFHTREAGKVRTAEDRPRVTRRADSR